MEPKSNPEPMRSAAPTKELLDRIHRLQSAIGDWRRQLQTAENELQAAMIEASGIAVGDVVVKKGKRYRVVAIQPTTWSKPGDKPWLAGNPERADGTFGTAIRNLYGNWMPLPQVGTPAKQSPDGEAPITCEQCRVILNDYAEAEGCESPDCWAQERGREIERLGTQGEAQ